VHEHETFADLDRQPFPPLLTLGDELDDLLELLIERGAISGAVPERTGGGDAALLTCPSWPDLPSTVSTAASRLRRATSSRWASAGSKSQSSIGVLKASTSGSRLSARVSSALTVRSRSRSEGLSPVGVLICSSTRSGPQARTGQASAP